MERTTKTIGRGVTLSEPVQEVTISVDEYLEMRYNQKRENLSAHCKMMLDRLDKYVKEMGPTSMISEKQIIANQALFLQTAAGMLEAPATDALLCWDVLLFVANKHSATIFNERTACRFYNHLPDRSQQLFLTLMTLVITTADARTRVLALRRTPLATITTKLTTDRQRANLAAYYAGNV